MGLQEMLTGVPSVPAFSGYAFEKLSLSCLCFSFTPHTEHFTATSGHQMCGFPPPRQFCILQFYSVLTLSTWRKCKVSQVKGAVPQDGPPASPMLIPSPGYYLCF